MEQQKSLLRLGIVGFSQARFDHKKARKILEDVLAALIERAAAEGQEIELVSGLTNTGVPKIAYELALSRGIKTVGFSAAQAFKVRSGVFPVDKQIIVGQRFGDESQAFIDYIDLLLRLGGGRQSRHEVQLFREKHKQRPAALEQLLIEHELSLTPSDPSERSSMK